MTRLTSWFVVLAAFSILTLGGFSVSEAAKRHAKPHHHAKHHQKSEIKVTVVDHSGKAVAGAKVHLHKVLHHEHHAAGEGKRSHASVAPHAAAAVTHKSHHAHHRSGRTAVTNASGEATLAHVRPGHYHVKAHKKGLGHGHRHTSVKAGTTTAVTVRLHKHGKHKGHVRAGKAGQQHRAFVAPH